MRLLKGFIRKGLAGHYIERWLIAHGEINRSSNKAKVMNFMVKFASKFQICTFLHRNFWSENCSKKPSCAIRKSFALTNRIVTVACNNDPSIARKM